MSASGQAEASCPFSADCPGHLEPEFDGTCEVLACTECGNIDSDSYRMATVGEDTCQAGIVPGVREFLGGIGRGPA